MLAALAPPVLVADDVSQAADVFVSDHHDVAAVTAIAPIGTAARNASLAAKAETPGAAIAGLAVNREPIDKHGFNYGRWGACRIAARRGPPRIPPKA